jgi:hypothetical protein
MLTYQYVDYVDRVGQQWEIRDETYWNWIKYETGCIATGITLVSLLTKSIDFSDK